LPGLQEFAVGAVEHPDVAGLRGVEQRLAADAERRLLPLGAVGDADAAAIEFGLDGEPLLAR